MDSNHLRLTPHDAGCTLIPQFIFCITFWVQYKNFGDICEGDEEFDKVTYVFEMSVTLFIISCCFGGSNKVGGEDDGRGGGMMRP